MIAVPILLSTLFAQAAPPAIDLSGLRAGLQAMRKDLSRLQLDDDFADGSWSFAFANPQDDDEDDDDEQEMRDRARSSPDRCRPPRESSACC
jgi:hypothetical protein